MKYTPSDFANARFAEHPNPETVDAQYAARMNTDPAYPWLLDGVPGNTDEAMSRTGWVPVPTKPTITESDFAELKGNWGTAASSAWLRGFTKAGGEIIPDPEPSNTERLGKLIRGWHDEGKPWTLDAYLDKHGVTAPKENK